MIEQTKIRNIATAVTATGYLDADNQADNKVDAILSDLFNSEKSLRGQNRTLFSVLHQLIATNQKEILKAFLDRDALQDFHPSLLKSTLIITSNVQDIQPQRERIEKLLQRKMQP